MRIGGIFTSVLDWGILSHARWKITDYEIWVEIVPGHECNREWGKRYDREGGLG